MTGVSFDEKTYNIVTDFSHEFKTTRKDIVEKMVAFVSDHKDEFARWVGV